MHSTDDSAVHVERPVDVDKAMRHGVSNPVVHSVTTALQYLTLRVSNPSRTRRARHCPACCCDRGATIGVRRSLLMS